MNTLREVNDDILKDLFEIRDESCNLTDENKKYEILLDKFIEKILRNICYWSEKYYRIGFYDGVLLIRKFIIK